MNETELCKLIAACKANKRAAQELLYKYFHDYGLSICLRYTSNREDAKEVLDDGFVKVFTKVKDYPDNINFKSWFRRILINTAIDYFRQRQRKIEMVLLEEYHDQIIEPEYYNQLSYDQLIYFVEDLSPMYRIVFNLYEIEGLNHEEIAKLLNISEGTSRSNLTRARVKLQVKILEYHKTIKIE